MSLGLPASSRLKSRKQLDFLFEAGKKLRSKNLLAYCSLGQQPPPLQAGFGISKKIMRHAVQRNRIKRLLRETYRLQKQPLEQALEKNSRSLRVFLVYTNRQPAVYDELFSEMGTLLQSIIRWIHENPSAHS